jgi:guanine nucleotide-binding protein subunit alpha
MKYARKGWKAERASWRAVIQLNLVRSINTIVETLQSEMDIPKDDNAARRRSLSDASHEDEPLPLSIPLTNKHQLLKLRLDPLRRVQADLEKQLGAATEEILNGNNLSDGEDEERSWTREFGVNAWKDALRRYRTLDGEQHMDEATEVIVSCKDDMKALWTDEAVRALLTGRRMRIEDSAGLLVALLRMFV